MNILCILPAVLITVLHTVDGYASGPPVDPQIYPNMCSDMFPTGHNATVQTMMPPFELVTSQNCYKDGSVLEVRIRVTNQSWYFEGFFVQARNGADNTTAYGMFDANSQTGIQELTCFTQSKSAIGHSKKKHYWVRTFKWTAPTGQTADLHFRSTLVKNQKTFWVGVNSQPLVYNASCTTGTTLQKETFADIQPNDSHEDDNNQNQPGGGTSGGTGLLVSSMVIITSIFLAKL